MKLGFDLDEVVCNLTDLLSLYLKETYGIEWTKEDFKSYGLLENSYKTDQEFSKHVAEDLIEKANDSEFQLKAEPYKEAAESIRLYKRQGHSIHFISCRPGDKSFTARWLRKYKIPFDTLHNIGHNGKKKGYLGRSLNLDMFVDDLERHLESMWIYKKRWRKGLLLFDRPWNQGQYDASKFKKVYSWDEIDRHIGIHNR